MINYKELTDIELFIKIEKYDPYAIEELYLRYSHILFPLIVRIVNDYQAAENILIDVFISVWRKIDLFNFESGNTYSWLITLARNKAVASTRQEQSEGPIKIMDEDETEDFYIMPDLDSKIESLDLSSALLKQPIIEEAVNKLTEAQKYVLFLSYYDGFTLNAIANKLNIPLSTIRSKITMSLQNLTINLLSISIKDSDDSELNEMIAAYAAGSMDKENFSYFRQHKETGGYLPERKLGQMQTVISLLPLTLKELSVAEDIKDKLGYKLLDTHKKIIDNTLADRRIAKDFEEKKEAIKTEEPLIPDEVIEKEEPAKIEAPEKEPPAEIETIERVEEFQPKIEQDKSKETSNSKSKLFWFFNFALLAALIYFSYLLSDETSQLNVKVDSMKQQLIKINSETTAAKDFISEYMEFIDFFNNPNIKIIQLIGGEKNSKSSGRIFVSFETGEGLIEAKNLPELQTNQYYSLWITINHKNRFLRSFKIIPEQKYIKISQIPPIRSKEITLFKITKETKERAAEPSNKIYLFGTIFETAKR